MDAYNVEELTQQVKHEQQETNDLAVDILTWFLDEDHIGKLYPRDDLVRELSEQMGNSTQKTNSGLSSVVGDIVDPVQQITAEEGKFVGIIDYRVYDDSGAYGYVHFDDRQLQRKRVVCAKCVEEEDLDEHVVHATQGEGSSDEDASWEQLLNKVTAHYADAHSEAPEKIEPGASLVSGTTISGNTSFHAGIAGIDTSNIDADAITDSEIDLSITPTWTGEHTFNSGLAVAEGQVIDDDDGKERIGFDQDSTVIRDDDGEKAFSANSEQNAQFPSRQLRVGENVPFNIYDSWMNDVSIVYLPDSTTGTLKLEKADLDLASTSILATDDSGSVALTLENTDTNGTFSRALEFKTNLSGNSRRAVVGSSDGELRFNATDGTAGGISLSATATQNKFALGSGVDLEIPEGQAIHDDDQEQRFAIFQDGTNIFGGSQTYDDVIQIRDSSNHLFKTSNGIKLNDTDGSFNALEYNTSGSPPGELKLVGADLDLSGNDITGVANITGANVNLPILLDDTNDYLNVFDQVNDENIFRVYQGGPVQVLNSTLQIQKGNYIQDSGGNDVFKVDVDFPAIDVADTLFVNDTLNGSNAFRYEASSTTPGTLELTNAKLVSRSGNGPALFKNSSSEANTDDQLESPNILARTGSSDERAAIGLENQTGRMVIAGREAFMRIFFGDGSGNFTNVFELDDSGNLTIGGSLTENGSP